MEVAANYMEEVEATDEVRASPDETLAYLIERSGREHVPVARAFLQHARPRKPGPCREFVNKRQPRALDIYLLLHGVASREPWDIALPAMVYGRALNLPETSNTETSVRNALRFIESVKLIEIQKEGRLRKAVLLRDDGTAMPYGGVDRSGHGYFRIPWVYFSGRWHEQLRLPGKVALIVALSQAPAFALPTEQAAKWFGISPDTLQRGFRELRDLGLIKVWQTAKVAPNARYGMTKINHYALTGPFTRGQAEEL
jgi:hypothetical protein